MSSMPHSTILQEEALRLGNYYMLQVASTGPRRGRRASASVTQKSSPSFSDLQGRLDSIQQRVDQIRRQKKVSNWAQAINFVF